jgi:hypothetical protein
MRICTFIVLAALAFRSSAQAQTTMTGTIVMIRTGWNDDSYAVVTAEPMLNPAGCISNNGYISHITLPGYST